MATPGGRAMPKSPVPDVEINDLTEIEFFTDVEGNWEWFMLYVHESKALYWDGDTRGVWGPGVLQVRANHILVYGGDCCDKGTGDIRLTKLFIQLQRDFPKQVFLLIGPRDITKLRFAAEIGEGAEAASFDWISPWELDPVSYHEFLETNRLARDRVTKLKWLLQSEPIGCRDTTFDTRKEELALLNGRASDADVANSYVSCVDPKHKDPWMLEYLSAAHIMLVLGDALFVHCSVCASSMGRIPGRGDMIEDLRDWVKQLDEWKDAELGDFIENQQWIVQGTMMKRSAEALIEFGALGFSTKVGIPTDQDVFISQGKPHLRPREVEEYLTYGEIRRVIAAGDPSGQLPTIVRHPNSGLLWCTCDLSNSDPKAQKLFNPASTRSLCYALVTIKGKVLFIEGQSTRGVRHECKLNNDPDADHVPSSLVGRQLTNGAWVRTLKDQGKTVVTVESEAGRVIVEEMSAEKACLRLKPEFGWGLLKPFTVPMYKIRAQALVDGPYLNRDSNEFGGGVVREVKRNYDFKKNQFMEEVDNYIFTINGVMKEPDTDRGRKVAANINALIDAGKRVLFVTNDSRSSRSAIFDRLSTEFGIRLAQQKLSGNHQDLSASDKLKRLENNIVTSAHTCGWFLKQASIRKPFVICSEPGLLIELEAKGIHDYVATIDKEGKRLPEFLKPVTPENISTIIKMAADVDAVVVGWDHDPTHVTMTAAVQLIRWHEEEKAQNPAHQGLLLVSCSMDTAGFLQGRTSDDCYGWSKRQLRICGNGVLTRSICSVVGMDVQPVNLGKPSLILMELLRKDEKDGGHGLEFNRTVIIGESLDSDITLANRAGIKSLLVLSGYTTMLDVEIAEKEEENMEKLPTWILDDFASVTI